MSFHVRKAAGIGHVATARMAEHLVEGTSHMRVEVAGREHTRKEDELVHQAERHLLRAARILRKVGNHMEQNTRRP